MSERLSQLAADPRWHDHSGPQPLAEMALLIGDVLPELVAVVEAAESLLAAEGLYEAESGRQHEVDALRQALAALGGWPKAGYDKPMVRGRA